MDNDMYRMHQLVADSYLETHQEYLMRQPDTQGYMRVDESKVNKNLDNIEDMKYAAAQFSVLFPAHYFKVIHGIGSVIDRSVVLSWLRRNPTITVVDVGCGAGAASAAMIAIILDLIDSGDLTERIEILCLGVDLAHNVLGIYYNLMNSIANRVSDRVSVRVGIVDKPVSESVTDLDTHLHEALKLWSQPSLAHVLIMQTNIVRPLSGLHEETQKKRSRLQELGIPQTALPNEQKFGVSEVRSYLQLFRQVPIDNLHIMTVGTDDKELGEKVQSIAESVEEVFDRHEIRTLANGFYTMQFENPPGSYWRETRKRIARDKDCGFHFNAISVTNENWKIDSNWQSVIQIDNLRLAWARVRGALMGDVFRDETEIRLFEQHLDANLSYLRDELTVYAKEVARTDDRLRFLFPKSADVGRPRVLSRMEEDILSVAIIQVLGHKSLRRQTSSYAYRLNPLTSKSNEFLFEYFFEAYSQFVSDIRTAVEESGTCTVLRVDIRSYFTQIKQADLVKSVTEELQTQSERIIWLLRRLLMVDIDDGVHTSGRGLVQGGIGSGFYANTYLVPVDVDFGVNNRWQVRLFRYADDIVLVIPNPDDIEDVKQNLEEALAVLVDGHSDYFR